MVIDTPLFVAGHLSIQNWSAMFCLFTFACSLQLFLLLAIILAFFLLTTSISPHVQLGLYNKYLKQHRAVFALSLLTVLLVGSIGAFRLVSTEQCWPQWPALAGQH